MSVEYRIDDKFDFKIERDAVYVYRYGESTSGTNAFTALAFAFHEQYEELNKLQKEKNEIREALSESRRRVSRLELFGNKGMCVDEFIKFAKSQDGITGTSKLMIHALGIAFKKYKEGG